MNETIYSIRKFDASTLHLEFGTVQADNDNLVIEASNCIEDLKDNGDLPGGEILKLYGKASLPIIATVVHKVAHLYKAIALWDPKLQKYVVCVAHSPSYCLGDLIDGDIPF